MHLNRNEKPNNWPKHLLDRIFSSVPEDLLQGYTNPKPVYTKLASSLGVTNDRLLPTSGVDQAQWRELKRMETGVVQLRQCRCRLRAIIIVSGNAHEVKCNEAT